MGSTISIIVRLRNSTKTDIISLQAYDIDGFDFGSKYRPDYLFNDLTIPAGTCIERMVELNSLASNCPFAMKILYKNGGEDVFKINSRCAYDDTEPNLRHTIRTHSIYYKKPGPRILEIVIQHTPEQKEDQRAEELNQEGSLLLTAGRYEEASIKLLEAAQKARREETKMAIRRSRQKLDSVKGNDIDRRAEAVNAEGLYLLKENKYQQAVKKFSEALTIAKNPDTIAAIDNNLKKAREAKANQEAKMLNQEGLLLRRNEQSQRALLKFEEALKMALEPGLIRSIKTNKAETLYFEALVSLESAWLDESSSNNEEAIYKFAKAKYLFEQADGVKSSAEYKKFIDILEVKIEGNRCFNLGLELEKEGSRLIDQTVKTESPNDCKVARQRYEKALKYYKDARDKFEEGLRLGDDKFQLNVAMTLEAIKGIEKILNELQKTELEIILRDETEE